MFYVLAISAALIIGIGVNIQTNDRELLIAVYPGKYVPIVHVVFQTPPDEAGR